MTQPHLLAQEEWNYWYTKVYSYFYRRVNAEFVAEELTANTLNDYFLTSTTNNNYGLMWAIAKNKFKDYLKGKNSLNTIVELDDQHDRPKDWSEYDSHYTEKLERLQECIQTQLKQQDYTIVELSIMCDFDSQRVSEETGFKPDNVRQRLSRALKKLRTQCREIWIDTNI